MTPIGSLPYTFPAPETDNQGQGEGRKWTRTPPIRYLPLSKNPPEATEELESLKKEFEQAKTAALVDFLTVRTDQNVAEIARSVGDEAPPHRSLLSLEIASPAVRNFQQLLPHNASRRDEGVQTMTFTKSLWDEIAGIYQAIIDHPFNRELETGTLPVEKFKFYIQQDALYLVDFSRALAIVGSKARLPGRILDFLEFAKNGLVVERALHEEYFQRFDVAPNVEQAPGCFAYTNYLVATASHRSFEEAVAALLPCFWIYREVGMHILGQSVLENPYRLWVDTYAGEEFAAAVRRAIDITDDVAEEATQEARQRMTEAFVLSSRLEWMFWDSAYRMEAWSP